jgi:predicted TIM-barrel fold metal-dependent hydrolase
MIMAERLMVISSDGHATARMADYRDYLDPEFRDDFDEFLVRHGRHQTENYGWPVLEANRSRLDAEEFASFVERNGPTGRLQGSWNPARRIQELEREGVAGEVVFPDFGRPFELFPPVMLEQLGYPPRTAREVDAGDRAYNRWLSDFCAEAPGRFAGMAVTEFDDVEGAIAEIRHAKELGLSGVVLPMFDPKRPVYLEDFDPIWELLVELDMPVNTHIAISAITNAQVEVSKIPHPTLLFPLGQPERLFRVRHLLTQLIWGGVLERHPGLRIVLTEQQSDWVIPALSQMDYAYEGSYLNRDVRDFLPHKPSTYFRRQCFMGASVLSRAEVEARHEIGVEQMMVGVDYPHHEGMWNLGTQRYLQATFGAAEVPLDEARPMLGGTAMSVFGFDEAELRTVADRVGPTVEDVLSAPTEDHFPRGDVHRPRA